MLCPLPCTACFIIGSLEAPNTAVPKSPVLNIAGVGIESNVYIGGCGLSVLSKSYDIFKIGWTVPSGVKDIFV